MLLCANLQQKCYAIEAIHYYRTFAMNCGMKMNNRTFYLARQLDIQTILPKDSTRKLSSMLAIHLTSLAARANFAAMTKISKVFVNF